MVRWVDGLYGGLFAGATSAVFAALMSVSWLRDDTFRGFFSEVARTLPPLRSVPESWLLALAGIIAYLGVSAAFGIGYAWGARRFASMCTAPSSVLWGASYGLLVWWAINDVWIPISRASVLQPSWQGLLASVIFYGIVLSEIVALARRREASLAP